MPETKRELPQHITEKLKTLIGDLEQKEVATRERKGRGEIELKISEDEALWFVAYKTAALE